MFSSGCGQGRNYADFIMIMFCLMILGICGLSCIYCSLLTSLWVCVIFTFSEATSAITLQPVNNKCDVAAVKKTLITHPLFVNRPMIRQRHSESSDWTWHVLWLFWFETMWWFEVFTHQFHPERQKENAVSQKRQCSSMVIKCTHKWVSCTSTSSTLCHS